MDRGANRFVFMAAAVCAFASLVALGLWQMERRSAKNDFIARFEAALSRPPAPYGPASAGAGEQPEFKKVRVEGELLEADSIKVLSPIPEGTQALSGEGYGYLLFTPLKFDGGTVFVNRGFVPRSVAGSAAAPAGSRVTLTGVLRLPAKPGPFTPPPDLAKHLFYSADIPTMVRAAELAGGDTVTDAYIEALPGTQPERWPLPRDPKAYLTAIPNRHLEYALTWFALAAALAVFTGVYLRNGESLRR
jgi:surfeit locus 1 family protein